MDNLWQKDMEEMFFREKLKDTAPEQLFNVTEQGEYFAYWPALEGAARCKVEIHG